MRKSVVEVTSKIKGTLNEVPLSVKLLIILLILNLVISWQKSLLQILFRSSIAGRDLVANLAFSHLFERINGIAGWSNLWFMGFPGFTFYPPLLFFVVNFLSKISLGLISINLSFRILVFSSLFLFPILTYLSLLKLGFGEFKSFFASILALYYVFVSDIYSLTFQTLNEGLIVQVFALNLFIILIPFLWRLKSKKDVVISSVLMGLIFLSHPFIGALAGLAWVLRLLIRRKEVLKSLTVLLIGIIIASPWLHNLKWLNYTEFYQLGTANPFNLSLAFIPLIVINLFYPKKEKRKFWLSSIFAVCFLLGTLGLPFSTELLPLQYKRFYHYSLALGIILAGLGLWEFYKILKYKLIDSFSALNSKYIRLILLILLLGPLFFKIYNSPTSEAWKAKSDYSQLYDAVKNLNKGRLLVEIDGTDRSQTFVLQENLPIKTGKPLLNELHVDSSLSSPYTLALQYWISENPLTNPVCDICTEDLEFSNEQFLNHLERFNVKWVLVKNKESKQKLDPIMKRRQNIEEYTIYEVPGESRYYKILKYNPILVISSLSQWKEFNREIFLNLKLSNYTFVRSNGYPEDIGQFSEVYDLREINKTEVIKKMEEGINMSRAAEGKMSKFNFSGDDISLDISSDESNRPSVLIKFSYFPRWECESCEIYQTSPNLMLIQAKGKNAIEYK